MEVLTESEEMEQIREQAFDFIAPYADKYYPERFLYEIRKSADYAKLDPDYMEADGSCTSYCEKCIDDAVSVARKEFRSEAKKKWDFYDQVKKDGFYIKDGENISVTKKDLAGHKKNLMKEYRKGTLFGHEAYDVSCSEYENFELCDGCGVIFQQGLLLTEQEVDHWETSVDFTHETCTDPYQAYQLSRIFGGNVWSFGRRDRPEHDLSMEKRVTAIAQKVIEAFNA